MSLLTSALEVRTAPQLQGLPGVSQPLDVLPRILASGSDSRIALDALARNGYGCRGAPCPEALTFSSSTASTISPRAYAAVEAAYSALFVRAANDGFAQAFETATENLRRGLRRLLMLDACDADIVLSPSGTDSSIHALHLVQQALGGSLTSIVVAAEETGSGVPFAAGGRHFNHASSSGSKVAKGQSIAGMDGIETVSIAARDAQGARSLAQIDAQVRDVVAQAVVAGRRAVVHVMHHSKIGTRAPSADCVAALRAEHGMNVQFVLDACQLRLGRQRLQHYLEEGLLVLVTGSKFFAGPPLSGAVIVPAAFRARLAVGGSMPAGLADYASCYDWPESLSVIREQLPRRENLGQYLRWVAAQSEMRAYFAVPELYRRLMLAEFSHAAVRAIEGRAGLALLQEPEWLANEADPDDEFCVRTVFPFLVRIGGRYATPAESRAIYKALNDDVSGIVKCETSLHASVAATLCHIGQPVTLMYQDVQVGALRVSADARLVSESFAQGDMSGAIAALRAKSAQLDIVLDKVELLARNLDALIPAYAEG